MAKQFTSKKLFLLMSAGFIGFTQNSMASSFQLWEQDGASIGNYHAGIAAAAEDASASFYNPAGLVRIKNQQLVLGGDPTLTSYRYNGTVAVNTLSSSAPSAVVAQGGGFTFIPFGHYAAPITERLVFGLSLVTPFGSKINYGTQTDLRYAATFTQLNVIDLSPTLAYAITDKFSFGAGWDIERMSGDFDQYATSGTSANDTSRTTSGNSRGYGYHFGALYQFTPQTRVGIAYHSQVVHTLSGSSSFAGPLAGGANASVYSNYFQARVKLPPTTSASIFHAFNSGWDVMGSVSYTQWNVFEGLVLQNVAGIDATGAPVTNLQVSLVENYRNTWNYSLGANYHLNDQWLFRGGVGYDQSPAKNKYRNVQLVDNSRIALALGSHYQATKTLGFDLAWTHFFNTNENVNNLAQTIGPQTVTTNGTNSASADVYGMQMKWDIL